MGRESAMQLSENTVVADRFRLHRMIGQGGMGSVWEATQIGLERPCALKFIEGEMAKLSEAHARFEREAKAAAHLNSPHIVQIFDHGVWQGTPYIAMELLVGEDLGKRLQAKGGKLEPSNVSRVIQQVSRALSKAHQAGVVHRDLKPDNIFLVRDDEQEIVKILDFGVAKQTVAGIDGSNTKTGAMLGTPYYMSPEQAQGIKSVDARSDLWSLAVIVYQCLTGRLPFESEALGDLLVKIIVSPIPVPSQIAQGLPSGFDRWWARAADRNPEQRFQTAKEFNDALQLALGQSSITEITDRRPVIGSSTAIMPGGMGSASPAGNAAQTAAMSPSDPRLGGGTPPPGFGQTPFPHPSGPNATSSPSHSGLGVPSTFGGVEPPVELPKKSPPLLLFGLVGALAAIGLGLGGYAMTRPKPAQAGTEASATAAPSAEPLPEKDPAKAASAPTAAPTTEPTPTATAAAAVDPAPTATPVAAATAKTGAGAAVARPPAVATPKPSATAAKAPTATPTPSAKTGPKPVNLGF